MKNNMYLKYDSKWGEMIAAITSEGVLKGLWFSGQKHFPTLDSNDLISPESVTEPKLVKARDLLFSQLRDYENGKLREFNVPIEPVGTDFQSNVWKILMTIPYGQSMTYGEISHIVAGISNKKAMAAQAVGQAVGHNPISIIIPCHRVLGKKGQLTGYAGGLERKEALLAMENSH